MEYLFTPWRMEYILSAKQPGCVFCDMLEAADDRSTLILHRSNWAFMVLNKYPYNNGHLMTVPYRHVASLENLSPEEMADMMALAVLGVRGLRAAAAPQGFNIGANIGRVAGAGVENHIHIHVVPRWAGDTNFMPLLAETRVIPQSLPETYEQLKAAIDQLLQNEDVYPHH